MIKTDHKKRDAPFPEHLFLFIYLKSDSLNSNQIDQDSSL